MYQGYKSNIQDLRSETEWKKIWLEAVSIAGDCCIAVDPMRPRERQRLPDRFSDTVVTAVTTGSRCDPMVQDEYRTQVYYATLDVVVAEMNQRFSDLNLSLLGATESLLPTSETFLDVDTLLPFLQHYDIDAHEVQLEASLANRILKESAKQLEHLIDVYDAPMPVSQAFPKLPQSVKIALTRVVSSASVERCFSSLRRIKIYLRSTMSEERLSHFSILHIERDLSSKLWNCG